MNERKFECFVRSLLENSFSNFRQTGKTKLMKDIYEQMAESFKRIESKRKESLFTYLWNKECLMDIASNYESVLKMEILSCYYISDENGKRVVFDVSFNEYEKNSEGRGFIIMDSDICEFTIKFYEKDGKADFEKIFAKLYYEIEDLYEKKIVSKKTFSDFVGFNIEGFFMYKPKDKISNTIVNNTVCGAFAPSDKENKEDDRNNMKDLKQMISGILGISEEKLEEIVESSSKKISMEKLNKLVDDAVNKIKEIKTKDFGDGFSEVKETIKNEGDEMKDFKDLITNMFGEEVADKAVKFAKELEKEFGEMKNKANEKVEEFKPKVEETKKKAKTVFETIFEELQDKGESIKGSFNAMKEVVKKPVNENETEENKETEIKKSDTYNATFTAAEVFIVNKFGICDQLALALDNIKKCAIGEQIRFENLKKDAFYENMEVKDSEITKYIEHIISNTELFGDIYIDCMTFETELSYEPILYNDYFVAKIEVEDIMDIYIKFVASDIDE